jgi:hypothetical protein
MRYDVSKMTCNNVAVPARTFIHLFIALSLRRRRKHNSTPDSGAATTMEPSDASDDNSIALHDYTSEDDVDDYLAVRSRPPRPVSHSRLSTIREAAALPALALDDHQLPLGSRSGTPRRDGSRLGTPILDTGSCPSEPNGYPNQAFNTETPSDLDESDERTCRICLLGEQDDEQGEFGRLFSPCLCSGSMRVSSQHSPSSRSR